jgi:hypothetical protein
MNVVFLVGNGLSVAVRPGLALPQLGDAFLGALQPADRQLLQDLVTEDLEGALANVEILRDSLHAIQQIHGLVASQDLGEIAHAVANTGLVTRLDRLYYFYCLLILQVLGEAWNQIEVAERLGHWRQFASAWIEHADETHLFTLNFDLLLEHLLLNPELLNLRDRTTDFFLEEQPPPGWWPPGVESYEFLPGVVGALLSDWETDIFLYHLHGSLSYLVHRPTGRVFKIRGEQLRDMHVYQQLRDRPLPAIWTPAIVLGGGKERKTSSRPYDFAFGHLERLLRSDETEVIIIVGYSFLDSHVNAVLRRRRHHARCIVIDHRPLVAQPPYVHMVQDVIGHQHVEFHFGGANSDALPHP